VSDRPRLAVAAALLLLGLAACSPAASEPATDELAETAWLVSSIGGVSVIPEAPPSMDFGDDGVLSGTTGCNTYTAQYVTDADRIQIGPLGTTRMACAADRNAQETAFSAAVSAATHWQLAEDGTLHLTGGAEVVAEAATRAPTPAPSAAAGLPGTSWRLVSVDGQAVGEVVPTLIFEADGSVHGSSGCNTYSGTAAIDGSTISFGPLVSTMMGCLGPAQAVETVYVAALQSATSWAIDGDGQLVLDGAPALTFAPA
jgi:heat shock protein HslJ